MTFQAEETKKKETVNKIKNSNNITRLMCVVFILFSIVFTCAGFYLISGVKNRLLECSQTAQGTIVKMQHYKTTKGHRYKPTVEYMVDGEIVRVSSNLSKGYTSLKTGDIVTVYYSPQTAAMWIKGYDNHLTFSLLGSAFLFIGIMSGLFVILAGIMGIRGKVLKGMVIFFVIGSAILCLLSIIYMISEIEKGMIVPFLVSCIFALPVFIFKFKKKKAKTTDRVSKSLPSSHI